MNVIYILILSILLQATAAIYALRLIKLTNRKIVWMLIATAISLMTVRRIITLHRLIFGGLEQQPDIIAELVALLISILMAGGILSIAPLFRSFQQSETKLKDTKVKLQRQLHELTVLHSVTTAGAESLSEDDLIERVTQILREAFYSDHFGILRLDEEKDTLHPHPSYWGIRDQDKEIIVPLGEGVAGQAAASGQPMYVPDVSQEPAYIEVTPKTRSELAVPIKIREKVIGVINAESFQLDAFSESDERLMMTLADQLAIALDKVRLFETSQRQAKELSGLFDTAVVTTATLDTETYLDRLFEQVDKLFDPDSFLLVSYEDQTQMMEVIKVLEEAKSLEDWFGQRISLQEGGLTGWVIAEEKPLLIKDMETDPLPTEPKHGAQPANSWLGVPLLHKDRVIGAMSVQSFEKGVYNEGHCRLLENLAAHVAISLENARLYTETEKALQREKNLNKLARTINSSLNYSEVLSNIVQLAVELVDCDGGALALIDPEGETISYPYLHKLPDELSEQPSQKGEGLAWQIVQKGKPILLSEYGASSNALSHWIDAGVRGFLGVPIMAAGDPIGALGLFHMSSDGSTTQHANTGYSERRTQTFNHRDAELAESIGLQAGVAIHNARLFAEIKRRAEYLQASHEIDIAISSSFDLSVILKILLNQVIDRLGADAADVLLLNPETQFLEYAAGQGFRTDALQHTQLSLGEGYAGKAARSRQIVHVSSIPDADNGLRRSPTFPDENFKVYYGVPLVAKGEVQGVLEIFHRDSLEPDSAWEKFLDILATQAAIAIDSSKIYEDLQQTNLDLVLAYDSTLEGWAKALELRDKETEGHTNRVTEMTLKLATKMGVDREKMPHIRRGALLHDIGKMGIPDKILQKPGPLTEQEWEVMHQHPIYAREMLASIKYLHPALEIPLYHHERWDGSGYPQSLERENIPLEARIFSVVDVWDALRSDRPYRERWPDKKVRNYIQKNAGKHFDPKVVEVFFALINSKDFA